jgi:hypothetical protein
MTPGERIAQLEDENAALLVEICTLRGVVHPTHQGIDSRRQFASITVLEKLFELDPSLSVANILHLMMNYVIMAAHSFFFFPSDFLNATGGFTNPRKRYPVRSSPFFSSVSVF